MVLTSLKHIFSTIILILVYLPRHFFLILVCLLMPVRKSLSVKLRLISLICIANQLICFYMIQILTEKYFRTDVSILIYVRYLESNNIFTEVKPKSCMCLSNFLYFVNKRINSRNTTK